MNDYKYSFKDLNHNPLIGNYSFKGISISQKCYRLFRTMIENKRERCLIRFTDQVGKVQTDFMLMEEISMLDGLFEWEHDVILPDLPNEKRTCRTPFDHEFKSFIWTTYPIRECIRCNYSPELDKEKEEFKKIHNEFMEFENNKRRRHV